MVVLVVSVYGILLNLRLLPEHTSYVTFVWMVTTIDEIDVTVTGNVENSCAFKAYVWDKLKYLIGLTKQK